MPDFRPGSGLPRRPQPAGDLRPWRPVPDGLPVRVGDPDLDHRVREHRRKTCTARGGHRRRLRSPRGLPSSGPLHPVRVRVRGPTAGPTSTQGPRSLAPRQHHRRDLRLAVGFFYFDEELQVDSFGLRQPRRRGPPTATLGRSRSRVVRRLFGSIGRRAQRPMGLQRRPALSTTTKDFTAQRVTRRSSRPLLYGAGAHGGHPGGGRRRLPSAGTSAHLQSRATGQHLRPRRHHYRPLDPGPPWCPASTAPTRQPTACRWPDTRTSWSFESGPSRSWRSKRLRLNLTGYWYNVNDQQITAVGGSTTRQRCSTPTSPRATGVEPTSMDSLGLLLATFGAKLEPPEIQDRT